MIVNPGIMSSSKCAANDVPRTHESGSVAASCSGFTLALRDPSAASFALVTSLKGRPSARAARSVCASRPRIPSRRTSFGLSGIFIKTVASAQTFTVESQPSLEQAEQWIREVLPEFESNGVTLGLENYEKHPCFALASLVRRLDSRRVGICLDTVNSLGALEPPEDVVKTLAPLTVNLHVKDFVIERVPYKMGFAVSGAPAGSGRLDIPWLLKQMRSDDSVSAILEQWPPPKESVEATIAMEQEWAEQGVQYLRSCGCS